MEQREPPLPPPSPTPQPQQELINQEEKKKLVDDDQSSESRRNEVEKTPLSDGKLKLRRLLNRNMKITMTDGRTLIGMFLCTDRNCNVILGSCQEYLNYGLVEAQQKRRQQQKSVSHHKRYFHTVVRGTLPPR